jgi:DnaJ-class molecular chaperone
MSIMTVTTRITHNYLMNKTKHELATWIIENSKFIEQLLGDIKRLERLERTDRWSMTEEQKTKNCSCCGGTGVILAIHQKAPIRGLPKGTDAICPCCSGSGTEKPTSA